MTISALRFNFESVGALRRLKPSNLQIKLPEEMRVTLPIKLAPASGSKPVTPIRPIAEKTTPVVTAVEVKLGNDAHSNDPVASFDRMVNELV